MINEKKRKPPIARLFMLFGGCAFMFGTTSSLIKMFNNPSEPTENNNQNTPSIEQQLQDTEAGYEKVLEREPENRFALQGLVETRIQMNDIQGAIPPLEKLIELEPENEQLQGLLAVLKQQVEQIEQVEQPQQQENAPEGEENQTPETENQE